METGPLNFSKYFLITDSSGLLVRCSFKAGIGLRVKKLLISYLEQYSIRALIANVPAPFILLQAIKNGIKNSVINIVSAFIIIIIQNLHHVVWKFISNSSTNDKLWSTLIISVNKNSPISCYAFLQ